MQDRESENAQLGTVAPRGIQTIPDAKRLVEEELARGKEIHDLLRELAQQKEWFEITLSSIGDAVITTDMAGRITFMNPVAEAMTGWQRRDADGRLLATVFRIIDERSRHTVINPVKEVLRHGQVIALSNHKVLIGKNGIETPIEDSAAPIRNPAGEIVGVVMVFHNVAEKQLTVKALREEGRALEILNMTGATIASQLKYEEIVKIVTDAATELSDAEFGAFFYTKTDDDGKAFTLDYVSGADRSLFAGFGHPRATPVFAPTFEGRPPIRSDDITQDPRYGTMAPHYGMPKGHLAVRSYLAVSVVSRDGSVVGGLFFGHSAVGVFTERAERIVEGIAAYAAIAIDNARLYENAQREIANRQKAEEALRDADRRKDEFLAMLAHELRNPLAPIRHVASLWQKGNIDEAKLRWSQQVVDRQSRQMALILDDLLDISRIKRGTLQMRKEWVELSRLVDAAIEAASPLINERRHELSVDVLPRGLTLQADPIRLTQVLVNLLINAAKYSEPGGKINLTAKGLDGRAEISVTDTGIGISPEAQARIFEIFFQSDAPAGRVEGGLGLGLSLVKGICDLHEGEVTVQSAGVGCGTQFIVRLPLGANPHSK
jgi:PAS domain S-box-containing protein